ncbi:MAG: RNA-binding domain-containing protein, partial [bacterium]
MAQKIPELIKNGESEKVEFKENFNDSAIETLVAFSNSKGGKIFIGINDKKKIIGVDLNGESLQKIINEVKQKTDYKIIPEIEMVKIDKKTIIVLSISEYPSKPLSFRGKYYKRVKN